MTSRTLLSLPAIVHESRHWRLPLCDSSVLALLEALAEKTNTDLARNLCATLSADPALAIWTVWQVAKTRPQANPSPPSFTAEFPQSITLLAAWLAPRLLQLLDWCDAPAASELSSDQHGKFAALVAESIGAAQHALRVAGRENALSEPCYLAALTTRWQEWLLAANNSEAGPVAAWPAWPLTAPAADNSTYPVARPAADEAWRRWLVEIPGIHKTLPALAAQLRRLVELEQSFAERLQTAKLESLKEFAYGAGHELNNPLANIASRAQTLLKEETHPERRRRLAAINTQAFRAHEMLADMMLFAHPPRPVWEQVDVTALVREVLAGLAEQAAAQQTTLQAPTRIEPLPIVADAAQLRVALRAVCQNSLEALNQGGQVTIEVCRCDGVEGSTEQPTSAVQIQVTDNGPGIAPEIRDKL
ncbi:MAG TPA: HAMP domain-containing sensor histidine kinase, partial [Pirellulales bacterium]|nr:HAMP domain-containing sensor histidine kinase [Pirellulales bacterium]